jgi:hypothetical protein
MRIFSLPLIILAKRPEQAKSIFTMETIITGLDQFTTQLAEFKQTLSYL